MSTALLINVLKGLAFGVLMAVSIAIWSTWYRAKVQKEVSDKLLVEFIPEANTSDGYTKLIPVKQGAVELPGKNGNGGKAYLVSSLATYPVRYPAGMPSIVQTKVQKMIVFEEDSEPASNRTDQPLGSSELLFNMRNEKFTELAVATSQIIKELEDKLRAVNNLMYVYVGLVIVGAISAFAAFRVMQMSDALDLIKAALGIK